MKPTSSVTTATSAKLLRDYAKGYGIEVDYSLKIMLNKQRLVVEINNAWVTEDLAHTEKYNEEKPQEAPKPVFKGKSVKTAIKFFRTLEGYKVDTLTQRNSRGKKLYDYWMIRKGTEVDFVRNFTSALYVMLKHEIEISKEVLDKLDQGIHN